MLLRLNTTVKSNERGCQRKGSHSAILIVTVPTQFQPMPLLKRRLPFDDPDWIYELKMDGFRALAIVEHGRAQLISRNGHPFASFSALAESISDSLPNVLTFSGAWRPPCQGARKRWGNSGHTAPRQ